jgi:peptidoglycan/xylan/chitin deacetylase (PgdA/CDA1 family)
MVVTVDDLPVSLGSRHSPKQWATITRDLLATLEAHGVPAVGFVNEQRVETDGHLDPTKVAVLKDWLDAGQELGNHSYSHPDLHKVPAEDWLADVARGAQLLRPLMAEKGKALRYFRHPFLHTGTSVEIQKQTSAWLARHGYTVAPVTMDNSEWVYGRAYVGAYNDGDEKLKKEIGDSYIQYMLDVVSFYEGQAQAIVGRPIPQVILIHAYALNADHLGTLLDRLEVRGYKWITLEAALADSVYKRPTDGYTGSGGITWLHRWAITEGLDPKIFQGEPTVPDWVAEIR